MRPIDPRLLRQDELLALARRLEARANSVLLKDQPEQQKDDMLAALAVRMLEELLFRQATAGGALAAPAQSSIAKSATGWRG